MNLYDYAVKYLKEHTKDSDGSVLLTDSVLDSYFEVHKASSLDEAFSRGVASINDADKRSLANPISSRKRKAVIDKVLCDLSLQEVRKKYNGNFEKLWHDLCNAVGAEVKPNNAWYKFAKNIISIVNFLSEFNDIDDLYALLENAVSEEDKIKLANYIASKIDWWGFPMANNWIKDMGMTDFSKPDRHVTAIIDDIYQTGENSENVFMKVREVAYECNVTPFTLDRVLYLVGSGEFYSHPTIKRSYNGEETEFIEKFKEQ